MANLDLEEFVVDYKKERFKDTHLLQPAANYYRKHEVYTNHTQGTKKYYDFWDEEKRRCLEGFKAENGIHITGYHYFYLNYFRIDRAVEFIRNGRKVKKREFEFPDFYDVDYDYFWTVEIARYGITEEKYNKLNLDIDIHPDDLSGEKQVVVLKARRKGYSYKSQPNSQLIETPKGLVKMGDLKPGNYVLGSNGKPTKVTEIHPQGKKEVFEVTLRDGRKAKCSEDHLWTVLDYKGKKRTVTTKKLNSVKLQKNKGQSNCYYHWFIENPDPIEYEEKELPIDPYIMGVYLGDGGGTNSTFQITSDDTDIIREVNNRLPNDLYINKRKGSSIQYSVCSTKQGYNQYLRKLKKLNLRISSLDKFIPEEYLKGSIKQRTELLKGLMDTDGTSSKGGNARFNTSSERLKTDICKLLASLGIRYKVGETFCSQWSDNDHWVISITTDKEIFNLERKQKNIKGRGYNFNKIPIVSIKSLEYEEEQTCITVDAEDHLYLSEGYVVTHNCASMLARNYFHMPRSKNFVFAFDKKYLEGDGIYQKFLDGVSYVNDNTAWAQPTLVDRPAQMYMKSGYKTIENGKEIPKGFQSMVQGISLKDNPDGARGKAGELIFFEEMGKFPGLKKAWDITHHTVKEGTDALGQMIAFGTGGCLTAGNKVWNTKGELVNIEDLNTEDGIIGYDDKLKQISKESISYWQEPKYKECVKLTTNTRRTIECSLDHPIFTTEPTRDSKLNKYDFKEAGDFIIGDKVAIADEVNIFGSKKMWNPYLVGLLIGDGTYGYNQTVRLSNADPEILNYVKNNFETSTSLERETKDGRTYTELSILNIRDRLRKLGIVNQTGLDKTLPFNIHQYNKKDLISLLSGFYDADGYVNIRKNKKRNTWIAEISLSSISEDLLNEVRFILQKFGIHGRMRERLPRINKKGIQDKNPWYEFTIADKRSLMKFANIVELKCSVKQERLNKIKKEFSKVKHYSIDKGVRLEKIVKIEYMGKQRVYNLTADNTNTYLGNGIITHNTEGADFAGAEQLFYSPESNDCIRINNKWDDGANGTYAGFFVPIYTNLRGFIDEFGNSKVYDAIKYETKQRAKKKADGNSDTYSQYVAETPFMPREAILTFDLNIFPTYEIAAQKNSVLANNRHTFGTAGKLYEDAEGKIKFDQSEDVKPVWKFPHSKQDDVTGAHVIYEAPVRINGHVPKDLYIACHDPFAQDTTTTGISLGATYIIKRTNDFSPTMNECIVASYVGRPKSQDDYNRNMFLLAEYYNAKIGFENDRGDVVGYARRYKKLHMLEEQFSFLDKKELQGNTKRAYGMNMTKARKEQGEIYIRDWLLTPIQVYEDGSKQLVLHTIVDPALLEELLKFNKDGNFDRCLLPDTKITTPDGYKKVQDLKENDLVLTHKGRYKPITTVSKHNSEYSSYLDIDFIGEYESLQVTPNHPIYSFDLKRSGVRGSLVKRRLKKALKEEVGFKEAKELNKNSYVLRPKRKNLKKIKYSDDLLYLMGWYLADGSLGPQKNLIKFSLQGNQEEMADKLISIINRYVEGERTYISGSERPQGDLPAMSRRRTSLARKKIHTDKYMIDVCVTSNFLYTLLLEHCGGPNNKKISEYLYNSKGMIPFIVGFLEGDGHQKDNANYDGYKRETIECSTVYEDVIMKVRQMLIDEGIWSSVCIKKKREKHYQDQYNLTISRKYINRLAEKSLKFHTVPKVSMREYNSVIETEEGFWLKVKSIKEKELNHQVYNFEVEEDHTYIASNIVTHNCMSIMLGMYHLKEKFNKKVKEIKDNKHQEFFNRLYQQVV